jgi:CheY-like chemotaxis protein
VQGIVYHFESFDALAEALETEDHEIKVPPSQTVRDGEWRLATFLVGEDSTSVAGRVSERGSDLRLTFEIRDWERLARFAEGNGPSSLMPHSERVADADVAIAPPGTTALVVGAEDGGLRSIVCEMLKRWGIVTECVASAEEALDWLRPRQAELVVMDVNQPGMPPDEFCRVVRHRAPPVSTAPPVLLLAADTRHRELTAALNAGADDFIAMPFRAPELRCRVLGLLRRSVPP